jgi:hypothetical protein
MSTIQLNSNHPDKGRAQVFLNSLNEKLVQIPFDWKSLEESDRISDAVKLTNTNKSLIITVIFVRAYADAEIVAKANAIEVPTRWGQNGSMMFLVECADNDKMADVLGTFAGKE